MSDFRLGNAPGYQTVADIAARGADSGKIRSKPDGTLDLRSGKGGLLARIKNIWSGRDKVRRTVDEGLRELRGAADGNAQAEAAIAAARKETRRTGHDARANVLDKHFKAARTALGIDDHALTLQEARNRGLVTEPRLSDLPGFSSAAHGVAGAIRSAAITRDIDAAATQLGTQLRDALQQAEQAHPGFLFSCVTCRCVALRDELVRQLRSSMTLPPGKAFLQKVVDEALKKALEQIGGSQCERDGNGSVTEVKSFVLDGRQYKLSKRFGDGGYGSAGVFTEVDKQGEFKADGKKLVLKWVTPKAAQDEEEEHIDKAAAAFNSMSTEALLQMAATKADPSAMIALEGAISLPDGGIALAMEYAELGTASWETAGGTFGIAAALHVQDPDNSDESLELARRTVVSDLLKQDAACDSGNLCHVDKKFGNVGVTQQGEFKLMDWGTGALSSERVFRIDQNNNVINEIANPRWRDPLIARARDALKQLRKSLRVDEFEKVLNLEKTGTVSKKEIQRKKDAVRQLKAQDTRHLEISVEGRAADRFSTGISIYELYTGLPPFDRGAGAFASDIEAKFDEYMQLASDDEVEQRRAMLFPQGTHVPGDIQDLILQLMHPAAQKRPDPEKLLKEHAVFRQEGIGSPKARADLVALARREPARDKIVTPAGEKLAELRVAAVAARSAKAAAAGDASAALGVVAAAADAAEKASGAATQAAAAAYAAKTLDVAAKLADAAIKAADAATQAAKAATKAQEKSSDALNALDAALHAARVAAQAAEAAKAVAQAEPSEIAAAAKAAEIAQEMTGAVAAAFAAELAAARMAPNEAR